MNEPMSAPLRIKIGDTVVIENVGIGVVMREAVNPKWPDDQTMSAFEIKMESPSPWRWRDKRTKIFWRNGSYLRIIQ